MKRHVIILLGIAVSLLLCRSAAAQEVVVDPTHIGVAVENTASSLEEMITMIEEMFSLNGKLDDLYGYERQLRYFHSCEMQGIKLFNQYIEYFRNLKTSDADKAEQAQKALKELDKRRIAVTREMASIEQSRQFAAGIADAVRYLDKSMDARSYAEYYRPLGSMDYAASSWIMLVRVIMGIVLMFLVVSAFIIIFRGQEMGTFTGAMALIRWFIAATVTWMLLELFNSLIV